MTQRTPSQLIEPELMRAALEILGQEGPEGFTVRAIARRANVAPMAIYNHFDGKFGLLDAVWTEGFVQLRRALETTVFNPSDPLVNVANAYRDFALTHRSHYNVMFVQRFVGFTPSPHAAEVAHQSFQAMVDIVTSAQGVGVLGELDAVDAAQMLWSAVHGFVSLEMLDINFAPDRDQAYALYVRGIERGLSSLDR
jgi:AcrR family transcriptional regulator